MIFDRLGEIDNEITKEWNNSYKESRQYITYNSLQQNL